jgi:hypothetical protein
LSFEVADYALEIGLVEDGFVLRGAEEEGSAAEVVDSAGDALGVVVDQGDKAIGEDGVLASGDAEVVFDVGSGFLEVEGFEVIADGNALMERLVGGKAELESELGLAEEDEGEEGGGVHVVVEQETELVEELRGQQVGFVDDEEGEAAFAGEVRKGGAELGEEAAEAEGRLGLQGK